MKFDNNDVHFNAIRKALRHGNAAVMVGAGFSRNARNGEQLATWSEMSSELWRTLNPDEPALSAFSTSTVTQLGEQYARVFSKPALEEVLKRLVPDDRVHPGDLHTQLLELPWVEIFTTNYDTLLERAAEGIVGRAHYTVTCREDIPQSKILNRRRIVKLHGSFPSQRPFIFTEDEYRRYPTDFAPFVNLVRQSLLENVFCLVGFSGDDPNFLHWIGWVRDMLDQHALPIYLLLNKDPSLGQRKLLDARQVTPIVLPLPPGVDSDNYPARLDAFFRLIDPIHDHEDNEWGAPSGRYPIPAASNDIAERKAAVIAAHEELASLRRTYPGWLVAPASVRQRLKHTIEYSVAFSDSEALLNVLQDDIYVATVVAAEYAWYQDVVLQSMDDRLAVEVRRLLSAATNVTAQIIEERTAVLDRFGVASVRQFRERWRALVLVLLRWAREGLHREVFSEVQQLLVKMVRDDAQLSDEMAYQGVLLSLYEGDRSTALRLLNEWEVKSADGYMFVRKGSLLSELGEIDRGFAISLSGLQQLRRNQRSRSDTTRYLSEEAWACTVIDHQQQAMTSPFRRREGNEDGTQLAEQLSRRLADLAAKGVDVRRELELLNAALEAEAATPSDPKSIVPGFELGKYTSSTMLGSPQRLSEKLNAAFSWLTLVDRVALVPRIGNTTFSVNSFLCAGWWVQYADSMQRVLSVLIRTMSTSALEERRPSDLRHVVGWLSRFQVGKTDESIAVRVCETSLALLEGILGGELSDDAEQTLSFHIQMFGRLVIRISDIDRVESYAKRVVSMHQRHALAEYPRLWRHFATALARCFEGMPPVQQRLLLSSIWKIATRAVTAPSHFLKDWVPLHLFYPRSGSLSEASTDTLPVIEIDELLQTLDQASFEGNRFPPEISRTWEYLYVLHSWSLLAEPVKKAVCLQLWRRSDRWPILNGFYPEASYVWGRPNDVDHHKVFREWVLENLVPDFPTTGSMILRSRDGRRTWGFPVDNSGFRAFAKSFEEEPWGPDDVHIAMAKLQTWWLRDWPVISQDIGHLDELRAELLERLDGVDELLALVASNESCEVLLGEAESVRWLDQMFKETEPYGATFKRFRIARSLVLKDDKVLWKIARELVEELGDPDISVAVRSAPEAFAYWLATEAAYPSNAFRFLVTSIGAFAAARRMPALPWILQMLADVATERPDLLDVQALELAEAGLSKMQQELLYKERKEGSGIPDDNVPILRFRCARLALAMRAHLQHTSDGVNAWIDAAAGDPLPEMRFIAL
ncbi:SIR2 family NAD-dependent protein deacylase [Burkholderia vietnamiensis]|uniref:SIR2 family NAD-dependent protein deacylase n=1 Tax=Burkholderia vietnamiensis TaxID=60552 RepID=UPI001B94D873|nr:SIR2 family protein [Burkholderia vietnamiensis]MBR8206853.1 SIR2 family protein [Burkholderia vietnamiensis]